MKKLVEFLFEVGMLKKTPRTGFQFLGSGRESVASHSFRTAVIGFALAKEEEGVNQSKVVLMCLFHDLPEARTGDHNYVNKRYVKINEQAALRDQMCGIPWGNEIVQLVDEFSRGETLEAKLARDADQLDLILELKEQLDIGNKYASDWLHFAKKRLLTPIARKMAKKILETDWTDWWFDKKTDWWVNGPNNQKKG